MTATESYFSEYTVRGKTYRYYAFDKIENADDAYFIGFMSADGSYLHNKKGDTNYPRMGLTSTSRYVVYKFHERYCPDAVVSERGLRSSEKIKANNPITEITFPRKLSSTFKKFGILDYKPKRKLRGIPKHLMSACVLGITDADGCFVIRHRKDCRTPRLNVHIVSGAINVLEQIQRFIDEELGISSSLYQRKASDCFELRINNSNNAVKFGNWIYSNLPSVYDFKKKRIFDDYYNRYVLQSFAPIG